MIPSKYVHRHPSPLLSGTNLAQLDHGIGRELGKSFEIKSGFHEVCTTFHVETQPFGETDSQLV